MIIGNFPDFFPPEMLLPTQKIRLAKQRHRDRLLAYSVESDDIQGLDRIHNVERFISRRNLDFSRSRTAVLCKALGLPQKRQPLLTGAIAKIFGVVLR